MVYRPLGVGMEAHQTSATDARLTEYLPAVENGDPSIEGAAKITYFKAVTWEVDSGESIEEPYEYRVECSCGEEFRNWGAATRHAEECNGGDA